MTKQVEQAAKAVLAYRGYHPEDDVAEMITGSHMLSDDANALQDLITDVLNLSDALGVRVNLHAAHTNWLAESHRCLMCGQTQQEIELDDADQPPEVKGLCGGVEERDGESGPHEFDDIQEGEDEEAVQELAAKLAEMPTAERIGFYAKTILTGEFKGQYEAVCPVHGTSAGSWIGKSPTEAIKRAEQEHKHD